MIGLIILLIGIVITLFNLFAIKSGYPYGYAPYIFPLILVIIGGILLLIGI